LGGGKSGDKKKKSYKKRGGGASSGEVPGQFGKKKNFIQQLETTRGGGSRLGSGKKKDGEFGGGKTRCGEKKRAPEVMELRDKQKKPRGRERKLERVQTGSDPGEISLTLEGGFFSWKRKKRNKRDPPLSRF